MRNRFAQSLTIGMYIATIGVVFMNADINVTGVIIRNCAVAIDDGLPRSFLPMSSIPPVSCNAAATTNKPAIISNGRSANPYTASFISTTPVIIKKTKPLDMTRSGPIFLLLTNATMIKKIVPRVIQASVVMSLPLGDREIFNCRDYPLMKTVYCADDSTVIFQYRSVRKVKGIARHIAYDGTRLSCYTHSSSVIPYLFNILPAGR